MYCDKCKVQIKYGTRCGDCNTALIDKTTWLDRVARLPDKPFTTIEANINEARKLPDSINAFHWQFIASAVPLGTAQRLSEELDRCRSSKLRTLSLSSRWSWYEYSCPFDSGTQFELWYQWNWRVHSNKEETWLVTGELTNWDFDAAKEFQVERISNYSSHFFDAQMYAAIAAADVGRVIKKRTVNPEQ